MAEDDDIAALVTQLAAAMGAQGLRLATAESCTGGLIAAACTERAGSSDWFDRGVVSYSNAAKAEWLGVDAALIEREGAVSELVAQAMAAGVLERSAADCAVAVTGIAGPSGGSPAKPVGTVWLAWARRTGGAVRIESRVECFPGDRTAVRRATVACALHGLIALVGPASGAATPEGT